MKNILFLCVLFLSIFSCSSSGTNIKTQELTLTILHINDSHSHLETSNYDITLGGEKTRVKLGGFPQLTTLIKQQETSVKNPVLIHAGDAITGTIYYSLFKGDSDAETLNLIDWDAFTLGNHEFDGGNEVLQSFLSQLNAPTISANVVAEKGSILEGMWTPYRVIEIEGEKVGLIGIDIVGKTKNSSSPGDDITFLDEIQTAQKYVAELESQNINKIFVVSHTGIKNAVKMASEVGGIDVIINGDSHTLMGGENISKIKLTPEDPYPLMQQSPRDEPVAIIQSWEYTKVLGQLEVSFDTSGVISSTKGMPMLILSDSFKRKDESGKRVELSGEARDAVYADINEDPSLVIVEEDPQALEVVDKYKVEKDKLGKKQIGNVEDEIPGGSSVRIPQKSQEGHFTAQVVANGTLHRINSMGQEKIDAVIQNAGGVRIPLVQGPIDVETVFTLLPFSNTIMTVVLNGEQIKTTLEQSVDYALNPDASTGSFPYPAGMRYTVDLNADMGSRISDIEMQQADASWIPIDNSKEYTIGVNNYIAGGKDGYILLGEVSNDKKLDLGLNDAQMFMDYVTEVKTIKKPNYTNVKLK